MKCKIQEKQIAIEGFLHLIENEGVLKGYSSSHDQVVLDISAEMLTEDGKS